MSRPALRFVPLSKLLLALSIAGPLGLFLAFMFPGAGVLLSGFIMFIPFVAILSLIFWVINGCSLHSLFFYAMLIAAAVIGYFIFGFDK